MNSYSSANFWSFVNAARTSPFVMVGAVVVKLQSFTRKELGFWSSLGRLRKLELEAGSGDLILPVTGTVISSVKVFPVDRAHKGGGVEPAFAP